MKELKTLTLNACWKKIWSSSVEIKNGLESSENEIGGILELATSIRGDGFEEWLLGKIKIYLLMEEEIGEADLLEMASKLVNQVDLKRTAVVKIVKLIN